jgi:molybdopterin-guanine dinucleotide biosynthesis protein MobB
MSDEPNPVPIVSFTGRSGTGKTTLLEKLVAELVARGIRTGVIKHTVHAAEFDGSGKDTHRLRLAGASPAAIQSGGLFALFQPLEKPLSLDQIVDQYCTLCDIVIAEGFKSERQPAFVVLGENADAMPEALPEKLLGFVCDGPVDTDRPVFTREDAKPLADFIQQTFLKEVSRSEVRVWADGEFIPVKPFVKAFIGRTVKGMVSALKGVRDPEKIHIKIGR